MQTLHPNVALLQRVDITDIASSADCFAENAVWRFFNPRLPEMEGEYRGLEAIGGFFDALAEATAGTFKVEPVETWPVGDELVIVQTCNTLDLGDGPLEVDVVVVWRIVEGKIVDVWDIPAVHSERPKRS